MLSATFGLHMTPLPQEASSPSPKSYYTSHLLQHFDSPSELKQLHAHLIKTNGSPSDLPLTKVASVCSRGRCFPYAQQIFARSDNYDASVWNSCLRALAEGDHPVDAVSLFYQMRSLDVLPDAFTCSFVLKACVSLADMASGKILHGVLEKLGFGSNLFLQNMILNLYALCGEMADALLLFDKMPQRDVVTWNTVITQLLKRGDIESASELFSRMPERNIRSWTLMISGCVQCGKPKEAIDYFLKLEEESELRPNQVTVVSVLAACADLCALDLGKRVHEYSNKAGFKNNVLVCNTLIDMYAKCGSLEEASRVFHEMEGKRTVVSWSAMIVGLAMHGRAQEALSLFSSMIQAGTEPNGVTFVGLLHACAHMGLIDKGRSFFASMTRDYGITPGVEHYGCIVDLLSRAGLVQEAYKFITEMPIKPNGVIWGALLGGCRLHKDIKLAEEAIQHLSVLDPLNDGYYIVLSNVYAEAGRWEDAARVRKLMKERGVKKTSGWSKITLDNGIVHEFTAGDESHPQAEGIFGKWDELAVEMKLRGYVPNTSLVLLDVEEEQKVKFLYRHSEKLAVSFGLLNTVAGTTIRIIKNLRVCEDCHSALKLISGVTGREIVVRDRNRFHCFKDGCCSCGDYW